MARLALNKTLLSLTVGIGLLLAQAATVFAEELKGQVDSTKLQGQSGENVIQGGIKNEASLNPSLKVIPGQARKFAPLQAETPQYFYPTGANLTQFHGNRQYPAAGGLNPSAFLPTSVEQYRGGGRVGHPIAPISSYTLNPGLGVVHYNNSGVKTFSSQSGVSSYAPGYEISKVTTHPSVSSYAPGYHQPAQVTSHGGIIGLDPYHYSTLTHSVYPVNAALHGSMHAVPGPPMRDGVTAYSPGYASVQVPSIRAALTSNTPSQSFFSPATLSSVTHRNPGYQISIKTPRNGVVSWDSAYEATVVHPGLIKNTLGGMYYTNGPHPDEGQRASAQSLPFKPIYAETLIGPQLHPLTATALGLPGTHAIANTEITWEEWYKRVARAVYSRWQTEDVGPGRATVSVTVTKDRMVGGKVIDFTPAVDVERNVAAETAFKVAALNAVNLVSQFEIPEFPKNADAPSVTFEVDLKRDVDGPVGFDVAAIPGSKPEAAVETSASEKDASPPAESQVENAPEQNSKSKSEKAKHSKSKKTIKSASKNDPETPKHPPELKMESPETDR